MDKYKTESSSFFFGEALEQGFAMAGAVLG
jgi:hypothetical protein